MQLLFGNLPKRKPSVRIASKQVTCLQESLIVISPEKKKPVAISQSSTYSECDSDCEIIEQETPIIEIDIDEECANEATESSTQTKTNETVTSAVNETNCASDSSNEIAIESNAQCIVSFESTATSTETEPTSLVSDEINSIQKSKSPEPTELFFIDKNPATCFEAPLYEIYSAPITNTDQNMAQNFRITVQNEKIANLENSFTPNPLLSSTHLNMSCDAIEESSGNSSNNEATQKQPENFHISINSTCENGPERSVIVSKSSPVAKLTKWQQVNANRNNGNTTYGSGQMVANGSSNHNTNKNDKNNGDKNDKNNNPGSNSTAINNHNKSNNIGSVSSESNSIHNKSSPPKLAAKRKASIESRDEPPSKRSHSESSDVIILNDSINDEDDSVVFVSETLDHQNRNRAALTRAANYIAFINSINQTNLSVCQILKNKTNFECNNSFSE